MKNFKFLALVLFFGLAGSTVFAQNIQSYKTKTNANSADRTKILDLIRSDMYTNHKQEMVFVVNKLNVYSNYAWFEGEAQRKDGKKVRVSEYDDCCHVEALLKKSGGKWYIERMAAFSTDAWWADIWEEYNLPRSLFFSN